MNLAQGWDHAQDVHLLYPDPRTRLRAAGLRVFINFSFCFLLRASMKSETGLLFGSGGVSRFCEQFWQYVKVPSEVR